MKRGNSYKTAIVKILEILRQDSDEDHPLGTAEILNKLNALGVDCDRRTLFSDIDDLKEIGYEIEVIETNGLGKKFFISDRSFDVPELRVLMDAVQAASFITHKKTDALIDKIAVLGGTHRAELLKRNIWFNSVKHSNESILYSINEIENAITNKKQLSFLYFHYNTKGEREYGKNGERYVVNPYATVYTNDNYYLICYSDKHKDSMAHYRIDRMEKVNTEDKAITPAKIAKTFDITKHYNQVFGMFTGETERVTFKVDNSLLDVVLDKFGEDLSIADTEDGCFTFSAPVQISPQFLGWCCSFGDKVKVLAPNSVVNELKAHIQLLNKNYQ